MSQQTVWVCLFSVALMTPALPADEVWKWSDDRASIMHYFLNSSANYEVQLIRRPMADWREVLVRITNGKQKLHEFKAHSEGNFVFAESVVIYTRHSMIASGCELLAYDLDQQKYVWRVNLKGLGGIDHSKYRNRINLELRKGKVVVYGNESAGQYIEVIDVRDGSLIENKVGDGEGRRFGETPKLKR